MVEITDFTPGEDKICLRKSIFGLLDVGGLNASRLFISSDDMYAWEDAYDLHYNTTTGTLTCILSRYGDGASVATLAVLKNKPQNLSASDIFVVE